MDRALSEAPRPGADAKSDGAGCGCTSGRSAFPMWAPLGLVPFRRRRR